MQGTHQLAGGVEVGGEIIHAKEGQGSQQTNLPGTMHVGIFLFFNRSQFEGHKHDHD